jgi:hypothetical protein
MRVGKKGGSRAGDRANLLARPARWSTVAAARQVAGRLGTQGWRAAGVGACAAVSCLVAPGLALAAPTTATFNTPGQNTFMVPAGVSSISVTAVGGAGGACFQAGGEGASVAGTFAVQPGQQLAVDVAGPGSACPGDGTGAAGVGGGGAGGTGGGSSAGGGGGASEVSSGPVSPGVPSDLLIVAGGGGGTAEGGGGQGGNAGSPGLNGALGLGGGAGSATAGGAGGADLDGPINGVAGTFGQGGAGGSGGAVGGGGGGGGYYGGGGGGGSIGGPPVGGGGGGSSFLAAGATNTSGPTPTTAAPTVTITYTAPPPPSLTLSSQSIAFTGSQRLGTVSPQLTLKVGNSGAGPLMIYGLQSAGTNPGDYLFADLCQQPVARGSSCQIGVRFAPLARGTRTATLTVLTNAPGAPATVTLSGTGGSPSRGAGPVTPGGSAGQVVCHHSATGTAVCDIECAPGTYKLQGQSERATFTIEQADKITAHGTLTLKRGSVTSYRLRLKPGTYTLTISTGHGKSTRILVHVPFHVT